jgi:ADP-heptose:LPS heptosyltransferase
LTHVLIARMDSLGDVLLTGPLVRAVAGRAEEVTYLCSPRGADAAGLLPGVDRLVVQRSAWIEAEPPEIRRVDIDASADELAGLNVDQAIIATSFHQSPLPQALLLKMAGVPRIGATSVDYPGSLLDVRHLVDDDVHEVERSLSLGRAMGFDLPADDDRSLQVTVDRNLPAAARAVPRPYLVVHPGASVPARAWAPELFARLVARLTRAGQAVVVTGGPGEEALTAQVAGGRACDLAGRLDLASTAAVIAGAEAIVVGNTGPAHLAAAVGTPVVSVFAPTVPAQRWRPWMVPHVVLGNQAIGCAGCRARRCPVKGHPCIDELTVEEVVAGIETLTGIETLDASPVPGTLLTAMDARL